MKRLIALGHKARSGKDTIARILAEHYGYRRIAFADPLKRVVAAAFPGVTYEMLQDEATKMKPVPFWPGETPARMCQRIAQGIRSEYGQDFWAQVAKRHLEAAGFFDPGSDCRFVITDMRTPAEAALVKAWGGVTVRVDRSRADRGDIGRPEDHWTEIALDDYDDWDANIANVGTLEDLREKVGFVMSAFGRAP